MLKKVSFFMIFTIAMDGVAAKTVVRDPFLPTNFLSVNAGLTKAELSLQRYPLSQLSMVGSVQLDDETWGIVKSPTGFLRVKRGDFLGKNGGEVVNVTSKKIEISDKSNAHSEKIIDLNLKEAYVL